VSASWSPLTTWWTKPATAPAQAGSAGPRVASAQASSMDSVIAWFWRRVGMTTDLHASSRSSKLTRVLRRMTDSGTSRYAWPSSPLKTGACSGT
jgi:hypothetical protein